MVLKKKKAYDIIALGCKIILLVLTTLVFLFALASGSGDYGGGITGIVKNSPNALPWLFLYLIVFITWKHELIGGILLSIFSIFIFFFFNVYKFHIPGTYTVFFIIILPPLVIGLFFIFYNLKTLKSAKKKT